LRGEILAALHPLSIFAPVTAAGDGWMAWQIWRERVERVDLLPVMVYFLY
jgi:hypothetical protein